MIRWAVVLLLFLPTAQASVFYVTSDFVEERAPSPQCDDVQVYALGGLGADGKAYIGHTTNALACATFFQYVAGSPFELLDGKGQAALQMSCDLPAPGRAEGATLATHQFRLRIDGTLVGDSGLVVGTGKPVCTGPSDIMQVAAGIDVEAQAVPAGAVIELELLLWYDNPYKSVQKNVHVLVGPSYESRLELPTALPPAPARGPLHVWENLTEVDIDHSFTAPHNATYHYNWTSQAPAVEMQLEAQVERGNATLVAIDASGIERFNATLATGNHTFAQAAGNWSLRITYDGFVGQVHVGIVPQPTAEPGDGDNGPTDPTAGPTNDGSDDGNATTTKGSPAPLLVLPLLLAALRRR